MELAPIVVFAYNRPTLLKQSIDAIKVNSLAIDSDLIVFSDGSKNSGDLDLVLETRRYVRTISGFKTVKIFERERNYGLALSIIDGVSQTINKYGKAIILEDDLITSPYFLKFINDSLIMYENDDQVISIHGYVYPSKNVLPESFFIRGADCWGWATWKRGWDLFEDNGQVLLDELKRRKLKKDFNFGNNYPFYEMLEDQAKGKKNSWAIRWYASAYLNNKFTLYPGKTLILNTGFSVDGTNTNIKDLSVNFYSELNVNPIELKKIKIEDSVIGRRAFIQFYKNLRLWNNPKVLLKHIYYRIFKK
jgi:hypothetical protein